MDPWARMQATWRAYRGSLLFTPTLMAVGALALFAITSRVDAEEANAIYRIIERAGSSTLSFLVFTGSAAAALSVLSSVAGTWATIVGVVFSITLVTIQLSATKYSAEVIPVFEQDRLNQITLGSFTATFVYSLLVLKTVRTEEGSEFVPLVGINVAILFAIVSLFLLVAFIGNLTAYIRPTRFVEDYAKAGRKLVPNYNVPRETEGWRPIQDAPEPTGGATARAGATGFLARVNWRKLRTLIEKERSPPTRVEVLVPVGWALQQGREVLRVHGGDEAMAARLGEAIEVEDRVRHDNPALVAQTLADVGVTSLSGGSTDVGVARAAIRGLLEITAASLEDPELPSAFVLDVPGERQVVVGRRQDPFHRLAFRAMDRILRKAEDGSFWDVGEEFARHVAPVVRAAAASSAWTETLQWLRPASEWLGRIENAAARARIRDELVLVIEELHRDGRPEAAAQLAAMLGVDDPRGASA